MTSFSTSLSKCPWCNTLFSYLNLASTNTLTDHFYTDGQLYGGMYCEDNPLLKCPNCNEFLHRENLERLASFSESLCGRAMEAVDPSGFANENRRRNQRIIRHLREKLASRPELSDKERQHQLLTMVDQLDLRDKTLTQLLEDGDIAVDAYEILKNLKQQPLTAVEVHASEYLDLLNSYTPLVYVDEVYFRLRAWWSANDRFRARKGLDDMPDPNSSWRTMQRAILKAEQRDADKGATADENKYAQLKRELLEAELHETRMLAYSSVEIANMCQLLSQLDETKIQQLIMKAEIQRELGEFDRCLAILPKIDLSNDVGEWVELIHDLTIRKLRNVAKVR